MPNDKNAPEPKLRQENEPYQGYPIGGQTLIMEEKCPTGWNISHDPTGVAHCVDDKGSEQRGRGRLLNRSL